MMKQRSTKKRRGQSSALSFRRILAGVLTLCMLVTMLPGAGLTAGATENESVVTAQEGNVPPTEPNSNSEEGIVPPAEPDSTAETGTVPQTEPNSTAEADDTAPVAVANSAAAPSPRSGEAIEYWKDGGIHQFTNELNTAITSMNGATADQSCVKLLRSQSSRENLEVTGLNFTLDLNGYTLDDFNSVFRKSTVIVIDSRSGGKITKSSDKTELFRVNETNFTLKSGTLENTNGGPVISTIRDSVITIGGGTIKQVGSNSSVQNAIYTGNNSGNEFRMSGGTVEGSANAASIMLDAGTNSITGGTITNTGGNAAVEIAGTNTLNISGGTLSGTYAVNTSLPVMSLNKGAVCLSGAPSLNGETADVGLQSGFTIKANVDNAYYSGDMVNIDYLTADQQKGKELVTGLENAAQAGKFTWKNPSSNLCGVYNDTKKTLSIGEPLTAIAITTKPKKTAYRVGETFDPAGMVVTASYGNDTSAVTNYTVAPAEPLKLADKSVSVSYTEGAITMTATQAITVAAPFTVSFDLQGGVGECPNQSVFSGDKATKPTDPTKTGYNFQYWYCDSGYIYDFDKPVTGNISLSAVWADRTAPDNVKISYEKDGWKEFLNNVTFGLFFKDTVKVKLTATDEGTGVKEFKYTLANKSAATIDAVRVGDTKEYEAEFSIDPQYKGNISDVTAMDKANNTSAKKETEQFAVDSKTPEAPGASAGSYTSGKWTTEDVTITLFARSALSGIARLEYSTDEGKTWNKAEVSKDYEATETTPYSVDQAKVVVSENCKDASYLFRTVSNAGIEGTISGKIVVNIDKAVPTIQATGKTDIYRAEDTAAITVTAGLSEVTKVEVKKDTGAFADITDSYQAGYQVTENGTYTFRVTNGANVTAENSITYAKIDPTKPVVTINSNGYTSDTWQNSGDITLDVTKDVEHGKIEYKIDNAETWQIYEKPIVISTDCKATIYTFKATSGAEVVSDEKSITVKRDTTVPADMKISYEKDGWKEFLNTVTFGLFFKDTVNVKLTAADDISGVKEFTYTLNDETKTAAATEGAAEFSIEPQYKGNISDVTAKDDAGNTTEKIQTGQFAVDKEVPGVPSVDKGGYISGDWTTTDVAFNLSGASALSGIKKYQYSTDQGKTWTDAAVVTAVDATDTEPYNVTEAKVEVSADCKDVSYLFRAVSNSEMDGTSSAETVVNIDKTLPTIQVTGKTDTYLVDDTAAIAVTASVSEVTKVEVKKDTGDYADITDSYQDGYKVTENGTYTFRVTNGANVTAENSITYAKIDPTKPVVTINSNGYTSDTWQNSGDITLDVTKDVEHGKIEYKIDNAETWQIYEKPIVISTDCKATIYTFKATSGAEVVSDEKSITIKRDTTVPAEVKISYENNGWKEFLNTVTFGLFFKDTVNVKLTSTDDISGVKEFTYTLKEKPASTITAEEAGKVDYAAEFSIEPQYKGNLSNVAATDHAGNNSIKQETQHFAVDKEVPGAPTVKTGSFTSGEWTKDDVTFTLTGSSALSGIAKYQYSTDEGKTWNDATVVKEDAATNTEPYNITEAKAEVSAECKAVSYLFRAVSNSGVEGTNSAETVVNIDKVVPTIQVSGKTDVYLVDDTATITVTAGESKVSKVEVKKDTGAYADITTSYKEGYKVTEKGTYTFRVTNGADVTAESSITYAMIDPTKPVVIIDSKGYKSDTWQNSGDITLGVTKDVDHGKIEYKIDNAETWQTYEKPIVISTDCKATIYTFKATSGAEVESDEKSITVKRDTTVPAEVKISYENNGWKEFLNTVTFGLFFKDTVNVKLTSSDDISGVKEFTYTLKDKPASTITAEEAGKTDYAAEFSIEPQYKGNLSNVAATDHAGNNSTTKATQHFAVDKEKPVAPTVDTGDFTSGKWTEEDVTLTLSGASALSGIAKYQYSTDEGKTWADAAVVTATDATEAEPYNITEAKVEVSAECKDVNYLFRAVSNSEVVGTNSGKTVVNIDKVTPTIQVSGKTDAYLVDDTATITVTAGESKVTKVEVKKDTGAYADITTSYKEGYKVTENGTYTFRVTNGADVTAESSITYTMIDPTKPVVTIDSKEYKSDTWQNSGDITLDVTKNVDHGKIEYKIDNAETWQTYEKPIVISTDCKATVYIFKATSGAGVVSDDASIIVKRDTTVPAEVKISYENNGWKEFLNTVTFGLFFKDTVNVKLTAADDISGVKEFTYTLKDKPASTITAEEAGKTDYAAEFSIEPQYKGNLSNVAATDHAGNNSTTKATQHFAVDKEKPAAPTVDTGDFTSGKWTEEDVTLTLSGASALSGIAKYQYSTDEGKTWTDATVVTAVDATEAEPYNITEAKVEVSAECKDVNFLFRAVSNSEVAGTNSAKTVVNIDKVTPTIQVTGKTDVYLVNDTVAIAVTTGESKVTKVEVKKDTGAYADITGSYAKGFKVTENGIYTFRVTNGANVTAESSITYTMIDPTKPVVTIDSKGYKSDTWQNSGDITLDVTKDVSHGKIEYKIDHADTWQIYDQPIVISTDCKATVYTFKATSAADVASDEVSIIVKRDTKIPNGDITFNKTSVKQLIDNVSFGPFFKDTVEVEITGTDEISEVADIEYIKSEKVLTEEDIKTAADWTKEDSFSLTPKDKEKFIIYARVKDNAGNSFVFGSNGAEFDTTAPDISGIIDSATYYTTQKAGVTDANLDKITFNGEELGGPVTFAVDAEAGGLETFAADTKDKSLILAGNQQAGYTITATDKAGNVTTVAVVMKPIASLTESIDALTEKNVKSVDKTTVGSVERAAAAVDTANATQEELDALKAVTDNCSVLLAKVEAVTAENEKIMEKAASFDEATIKTSSREELKQLRMKNEALLSTDNLTEEEIAALNEVNKKIDALFTKVDEVEAEKERITAEAGSFDEAAIKTTDREKLEKLKAANEALLNSGNLTAEEKAALIETNRKIDGLLTKVTEAEKAQKDKEQNDKEQVKTLAKTKAPLSGDRTNPLPVAGSMLLSAMIILYYVCSKKRTNKR